MSGFGQEAWLAAGHCPQHARDPLVGCLFAAVFSAVIICMLVAIATVAG